MMAQYPWRGAALRITDSAYQAAGQRHNLDPAIIRAVFSVESAGSFWAALAEIIRSIFGGR